MSPVCKQCRRLNPLHAVYCYHDGVHLGGNGAASHGEMKIGGRPFSFPFTLPSGQDCHNFNELARACRANLAVSLDMLRKGHLESFLAGQGRADLAEAAHVAARAPDRQRGLDEFLGRLPGESLVPAKLRVEPAVLELGILRPGEDRRYELILHNAGERLLYGSVSVSAPWLSLGDKVPAQEKLFQFNGRVMLPLHIKGACLRAYREPQQAKVRFSSNGGSVAVVVRLSVPGQPFPTGALAGATSPRELAEKTLKAPAEAAALIEAGAVARWYEENGWDYPVLGPAVGGPAALQQFLEALGLARPPQVELSEDAIHLHGPPGAALDHVLAILTQELHVVVAHGSSDQPWLRVGRAVLRGRNAFLPLNVAAVPARPGETLQAQVTVTANGGQQFVVPVTLKVDARTAAPPVPIPVPPPKVPAVRAPAPSPKVLAASAPAARPAAPPPPPEASKVTGPRKRRSLAWTLVPAFLLVATLGGVALRDYLLAPLSPSSLSGAIDSEPRIEIRFHDGNKGDDLEKLYLTGPQPTMRFGLVMLQGGQPAGSSRALKRLTFDPWGRTNNACLRYDGTFEHLVGSGRGSWRELATKGWSDAQGDHPNGTRSVWVFDDVKIQITQMVDLVRGEQSKLLDTCQVRYRIENLDTTEHKVGLRFLLDTYIGGNDGVPFTIPGESELCDTTKDLPKQAKDGKVPDFLQALEKPDLSQPGTVAHLKLKMEGLEAPARVTLGAWPDEALRVNDWDARGPGTLWDVPVLPIKTLNPADSAVTIYWAEQPLKPGASREVGFEYGLYTIGGQSANLALAVEGVRQPRGELTVVAYVNKARDRNETATITLPTGFELIEGDASQTVPQPVATAGSTIVPVTWKVRAGPAGKYDKGIKVGLSTGATQAVDVEIHGTIFD